MKCQAVAPAVAAADYAICNSMSASLHVLILAAGASSRLGQPKQLVRIAGEAVLQRVVSAATAANGEAVTVVLGAQAADIAPLLKHSAANMLVNRGWQEGLAASIRAGLNAIGPGVEAALIVLGDQYALTPADLKRLIDAWQGQESIIAAAQYNGQCGVPAIFPRWCFSELLTLRGDQGAKTLLKRYADRLRPVPMPNAALDLDTAADLQRIENA